MQKFINESFLVIGIAVIVTLVWQGLELAMSGEIKPNKVDTVIAFILTLSLYFNLKKKRKCEAPGLNDELRGSCNLQMKQHITDEQLQEYIDSSKYNPQKLGEMLQSYSIEPNDMPLYNEDENIAEKIDIGLMLDFLHRGLTSLEIYLTNEFTWVVRRNDGIQNIKAHKAQLCDALWDVTVQCLSE